jgi:hypothetical protein
MPSSTMLHRIALVITDVSEELSASIIRVTSLAELGTLALTSRNTLRRLVVMFNVVPSSQILVTPIMEALGSSEISVIKRATRRNIPEDGILHQLLHFHLTTGKTNRIKLIFVMADTVRMTQRYSQVVSPRRCLHHGGAPSALSWPTEYRRPPGLLKWQYYVGMKVTSTVTTRFKMLCSSQVRTG